MIFNLVGSLNDGFILVGPFDNIQDATDWQDGCDCYCEIVIAQSPEEK